VNVGKTTDDKGLHALSEDTLGFGVGELKTARDVLLRPRYVLEAWMTAGPTGGGGYARPLRLYLALNAVLMLILFLRGGAGFWLNGMPPEFLSELVQRSGKSQDAFLADADAWMTLVMVPILAAGYALAAAPLLRWWDPEDLGSRRGFRAAFGWLCAWTVPMMPLSWWAYGSGPETSWIALAIFVLGVVAFMRMGAGRWYRSPAGGLFKGIVLAVAMQLVGLIGMIPILMIGLLAGVYGA
jgi:hypothetical protein